MYDRKYPGNVHLVVCALCKCVCMHACICLYATAAILIHPIIAERVQHDDLQLASIRRDEDYAPPMFVDAIRMNSLVSLILFFFYFLFLFLL